MPLLRLHSDQDDDPGRRHGRRGSSDSRIRRGVDRERRLDTGRPAHPRRGHRQLERPRRRRAIRAQGRPLCPWGRHACRPRQGFGQRHHLRGLARDRHRDRDITGGTADPRAGPREVLDQPRGRQGRAAAGVPRHPRRRRHRRRARAGLRSLRREGHDHRRHEPGPGDGRTGSKRRPRRGSAARWHRALPERAGQVGRAGRRRRHRHARGRTPGYGCPVNGRNGTARQPAGHRP